jgi:CHASE2 domain-containing sensor protein
MLAQLRSRYTLIITFSLLVVLALVQWLPWSAPKALEPVTDALADVRLSDFYFSRLRTAEPPDSQIAIVNIGRMSRAKIAHTIERIAATQPKVIGVDAFFRSLREPTGDSLLAAALHRHSAQIVLVNELSDYDPATDRFRAVLRSHPQFSEGLTQAYANVSAAPESPFTIRSISPAQPVGDTIMPSFALALAERVDPAAAKRCLDRANAQELINWRGSHTSFYFVDTAAVLDSSDALTVLKGKIVLLAFVDLIDRTRSLEDNYFTPLNERFVGKAYPDMYGIVIHANMLSMILRGQYVSHESELLGILLASALAYAFVAFLLFVANRLPTWFSALALIAQLGLLAAAILLWLGAFDAARLMLPLRSIFLVLAIAPLWVRLWQPLWATRTVKAS